MPISNHHLCLAKAPIPESGSGSFSLSKDPARFSSPFITVRRGQVNPTPFPYFAKNRPAELARTTPAPNKTPTNAFLQNPP